MAAYSVGHRHEVWSFDVNEPETRLVTGSSDGELRVYQLDLNAPTPSQALSQSSSSSSAAPPSSVPLATSKRKRSADQLDEVHDSTEPAALNTNAAVRIYCSSMADH